MRRLIVRTGEQEKGRSFQAVVLACVEAQIWDGAKGGKDVVRPALLSIACSVGEAAPIFANLRVGRKASYLAGDYGNKSETLELLKTAGYAFAQQRCAAGVRIDAYLPRLFDLDPGFVDGDAVAFVCLPDRAWLAAQDLNIEAALAHIRRVAAKVPYELPPEAEIVSVVPYAPLFAKYLLGRCRLPMIPEIGYLAQVLVAALAVGLARRAWGGYGVGSWGREQHSWGGIYEEKGVVDAGFAPGICFSASRADLENLLSTETVRYIEVKR